MPMTLADCQALDAQHARTPTGALRARFAPGEVGTVYLDANSIGPMPADVPARMQHLLAEGWAAARRRGWSRFDWLEQPTTIGDAIAPILGAQPGDIRVCDSTSVNQYKLLRHALAVKAPRRVLVVQDGVFPSNRQIAEGLARAGLAELRPLADDAPLDAALDAALAPGDVAVVALSHVDYRHGERLDMAVLTQRIHAAGALGLWDLSHSAGVCAIALRASGADMAVGCGYKYLCGGPGAPAFVYLRPGLAEAAWPALCGWMGHADTFGFAPGYAPASGVGRFLVGTPPVLALAAFGAAAALWREVDPAELAARHQALGDTLLDLVDTACAGTEVTVVSPRAAARRGGHIALQVASDLAADIGGTFTDIVLETPDRRFSTQGADHARAPEEA
jgi:kynureninase